MEQLSLLRLFLLNLRLASLTFGGGDPTMAAMQSEMVSARKWLAPEQYGTSYALARITPGTNMLAFCAGTAWQLLGWPGAVVAVLAASVPAAVIVMLLTGSYEVVQSHPKLMAAVAGTLAAAVGMTYTAAWNLLQPYLVRRRWVHAVVIAGASIALLQVLNMAPIQVLGLAAVVGLVWRIPE